jgi:hypothetical protein
MTSTLGGDDPLHDLPEDEKNRLEEKMRKEAREKYGNKPKERNRRMNRANEISRKKSKRAHQD